MAETDMDSATMNDDDEQGDVPEEVESVVADVLQCLEDKVGIFPCVTSLCS